MEGEVIFDTLMSDSRELCVKSALHMSCTHGPPVHLILPLN